MANGRLVLAPFCFGQSKPKRGLAMNKCGVENRHWYVALVEQHADLCAAENQAVGTALNKVSGNRDVDRFAVCEHYISAKLLIDNPVRFRYGQRVRV